MTQILVGLYLISGVWEVRDLAHFPSYTACVAFTHNTNADQRRHLACMLPSEFRALHKKYDGRKQ